RADLAALLRAGQVGRVGVGERLVVLAIDGLIDELRLHHHPVEVLVIEGEGDEGVDTSAFHFEAVGDVVGSRGEGASQAATHVPDQLAQGVDLAGEVQVEGPWPTPARRVMLATEEPANPFSPISASAASSSLRRVASPRGVMGCGSSLLITSVGLLVIPPAGGMAPATRRPACRAGARRRPD